MSAPPVVARVLSLPDLGEGLTEAEIVEWLVAEGDVVAVDQPVVQVLTAKATVEIPSPFAGEVVRRHAVEGETVPVGAALLTVVPDAEATGDGRRDAGAGVEPPVEPGHARAGVEPADDTRGSARAAGGSGSVLVGYGTASSPGPRRRRPPLRRGPVPAVGHVVATPTLRHLARDRGVDLATLAGSGPGGRITRADVETAAVASGAGAAERVVTTGVRRATAARRRRSRRDIPDVTVSVDA